MKTNEPRLLLIKSHVSAYTRKDGTFVAEHEDSRVGARQKQPNSSPPIHVDASELADSLESEFPGLKLDLFGKGGRATLSRIVVPKEGRESGVGTKVMQRVVQWADSRGVQLALSPSADFGGKKSRLVDFYKRFGFLENKGKNRDFEVSESMHRAPK